MNYKISKVRNNRNKDLIIEGKDDKINSELGGANGFMGDSKDFNVEKNNNNKIYPLTTLNSTRIKDDDFLYNKEKEKEIDKEKKIRYKLLRDRERQIVEERKKKIEKLSSSLSDNNRYVPVKNYTTAEEKEEKRLKEEENLVLIENKKRKIRLQPIKSEELNKFSKEVTDNERKLNEELKLKKMQMNNLWKERKSLLPEFKSKYFDINEKMSNELKEEEIQKKERVKIEHKNKIDFGENVLKNYQPKIILNEKLRIERENNIKKLKGINRKSDIKNLDNRIRLKSEEITKSQPKNFRMNNRFNIEEAENNGNRNIKPIIKLTPLEKPKDYLVEERQKKMEKISTQNDIDIKQKNSLEQIKQINKWQSMLNVKEKGGNENKNNSGNTFLDNVEKIKIEAEMLQNKADNKRVLLKHEKYKTNLAKSDDLNNEIADLYTNSIQAKLEILKKINSFNSE